MITEIQAKQFLVANGQNIDDKERLSHEERHIFFSTLAYKFGKPLSAFMEFLSTPGLHPEAEEWVKETIGEVEGFMDKAMEGLSDFIDEVDEGIDKALVAVGDAIETAADVVADKVEDIIDALDGESNENPDDPDLKEGAEETAAPAEETQVDPAHNMPTLGTGNNQPQDEDAPEGDDVGDGEEEKEPGFTEEDGKQAPDHTMPTF